MNVDGTAYRTVWVGDDRRSVHIIDQTRLPHEFVTRALSTVAEVAEAIKAMRVRGAPLIGATAAYGVCLALAEDPGDAFLEDSCDLLLATRPTAVNLRWAVDKMKATVRGLSQDKRLDAAYIKAAEISEDDVVTCASIGEHGLTLIQEAWESSGKTRPVEILTHCNAGWLATVDWGTATAPIYKAHDTGIPVHVWVDETRPRNQGASLTAWELGHHGVAHTVIVDSAAGHLMQHGRIDLCITGTDRTTASGDVCNKIGTYQKALAAHDNDVPFYVGLPHSTIDWAIHDGVRDIPIEERNPAEVTDIIGRTPSGEITTVQLTPDGSPAANFAFDVTPARLVSGLITERGICPASAEGLARLYPERVESAA